jgi:hypothetical protein
MTSQYNGQYKACRDIACASRAVDPNCGDRAIVAVQA